VKRADKARRIRRILDELFPEVKIPLEHEDPYTLLIAVLLSAQCTDVKVNQISPLLFARAATPEAMLKLPVAEIQRVIRPCGLSPAKAKAIAGLSKILVEQHGGRVPATFEALEALPGVGHKTASVVMVQAHGQPAFPVDTHIHRLAARWGLSSGRSVEQTERDLKRLFPEPTWGRVHLQIILFGRSHCPARGHDLTMCPICSWAASKARIRSEAVSRRKRSAQRAEGDRRINPAGSRASAAGRARPRRARAAARRSRRGSW
jgi:endonuclease-3